MANTALETSFRDAPFDALADTYDQTFTFSQIGRAQREAVTREMDRVFRPGGRVLEINCGTGVDAVCLASRGVEVLACDAAPA
jgi:ubiquinone/menaquinone biosynthesis C-methylase UbiE